MNSPEIRMPSHPTSVSHSSLGTAAVMVTLLAAGVAGATVGGPLWGFLGAAALLIGVGWICHLLQYDQDTAELERCYDPPETAPLRFRVTTRAAVQRRMRSFVLIPLSEMESLSS